MSKFVTYPAVTVLDNDHSLLIDSPNAGTNSITANNAANTLLSKWSGFDTFNEAVQNTISNNQEFIDRDAAIRSETADLKRKIVTTFPAKEASGQIATFESEFEDAPLKSCIVQVEPVQDLHGYDSPWPAGGGKNKFDSSNPYNFNEKLIVFGGTAQYIHNTYLEAGTYTVSVDGVRAYCFCRLQGTTTNTIIKGKDVLSQTFTLEESGLYAIWLYNNTDDISASSVNYVQIESGSTATAYAPYSNICPISGWTGCKVQRTGKNIWDEEWELGGFNSQGNPTTSSSYMRSKNYIPLIPNATYYFVRRSIIAWVYYYTDTGYIKYVQLGSGVKIFTPPSNATRAKFLIATSIYGTTYNHDISINYPSTDHDYHPYVGQTYPITFPSEAGTVYGGTLDVTKGELVVEYVRRRVNSDLGSVNFSTGRVRYTVSDAMPINAATSISDANIMCSHFPKVSTSSEAGCRYSYGDNYTVAFILFQKIDAFGIENTLEGWNAFLEAHEVYVTYRLAEPIHYPLTTTEIKTLLGTNNVWANTGDTAVEYLMSDVGWYVEKKLRAFQSILAGVEDSAVASKNYSTDSYLIFNNDIYRVTKTITAGETIEDGVNVTKTTVAEQLMALAQV